MAAQDAPGLLAAVAKINAGVRATGFPVRAEGLADEIQSERPDLVGLREVATWTATGPGAGPSQDFLAILQRALHRRGLRYAVAATSAGTDVGPIPLISPCASVTAGACTLRFQDREMAEAPQRRLPGPGDRRRPRSCSPVPCPGRPM